MGATHLPSTEFDGTERGRPARGARPRLPWASPGRNGPAAGARRHAGHGLRCSPSTPRGWTPRSSAGFYADMAAIRRFDQEATALQRQGQLALWVPLTGQEAAQIGSGRASQPQDYIFPTYREHGVALTRNVDLAELLRQFRGVSNGGWNPKDTNFHLYTLVLAAQTPHAVGYAMGIQRDQRLAEADSRTTSQAGAEGRRHGLFRRRRQLRGRRPRIHGVRLLLQRAGGVLLPEQPLGHLGAHCGADPDSAVQPRQGLRLPGHPRGRQRRHRRPRRHRVGAGARPRRATARC